MRFSSVDALFEDPPRRSLPSNLSQLGIGRRANKKPRPIAGRGCVGSDTKILCMRFCCRTGSTPRHPNTLSLFRYDGRRAILKLGVILSFGATPKPPHGSVPEELRPPPADLVLRRREAASKACPEPGEGDDSSARIVEKADSSSDASLHSGASFEALASQERLRMRPTDWGAPIANPLGSYHSAPAV